MYCVDMAPQKGPLSLVESAAEKRGRIFPRGMRLERRGLSLLHFGLLSSLLSDKFKYSSATWCCRFHGTKTIIQVCTILMRGFYSWWKEVKARQHVIFWELSASDSRMRTPSLFLAENDAQAQFRWQCTARIIVTFSRKAACVIRPI